MNRRWIRADYPSKKYLSRSEAMGVLHSGPNLEWLSPFAILGEVRTDQPNRMPYGLVHWYYDAEGNPKTDVQTFYSVQGARWAAEWLYGSHQEGCRCVAVFYWTPETVNYGIEAIK
jgi:hypothetical protein